jgi:hypothetical protein
MLVPQVRKGVGLSALGESEAGLDEGWDLDAFDSTPVLIHDAPRSHAIVLWIGYATGPRVNASCKGPDQKEVDALVASFASG